MEETGLEMLVGLNVVDDAAFQIYRDEMTPLLEGHGGSFGYDFNVSEVLKTRTAAPINRVFTINFPSEEAMDAFFSNEVYQDIAEKHFENAVTDTTMIATYEV